MGYRLWPNMKVFARIHSMSGAMHYLYQHQERFSRDRLLAFDCALEKASCFKPDPEGNPRKYEIFIWTHNAWIRYK